MKLYHKIGMLKIAIMPYNEIAIISVENKEAADAKANATYPAVRHSIGCERQPASSPPTL
ncbi:hypothetical protein KSF_106030 [Reticulibacter mediterranei]|uniref:Uncharacterized protein n=1 Tax=Reticulibacter mediterranei TaxID=2778369 RepID=A0A8J3N9G3_9CHLR|nr:hypothetical protein KSF_106030 [Reticulibacter mediterranei]